MVLVRYVDWEMNVSFLYMDLLSSIVYSINHIFPVADFLAKFGAKGTQQRIYSFEELPHELREILRIDRLRMSNVKFETCDLFFLWLFCFLCYFSFEC